MNNANIRRGQIYFCDIPETVGSVYHSCRPVLIISNNLNNRYSGCVTAIPLTSRKKRSSLPTHVPLQAACGTRYNSVAMCENVCNYSKESLCNLVCELDEDSEEMKKIERALLIQMGMA